MLGDINWEDVNVAGAFILGAALATIATLRVVRAVSRMFEHEVKDDKDRK